MIHGTIASSLDKMERYERHLEQTKGKQFLEEVFGRQYQRYSTPQLAAFLHLYTYNRISYESRHYDSGSRRFRTLHDIHRNGGNCEEKTVFLASLLRPVSGINCRFVSVKRDGAYHLLLQLQFTRSRKTRVLRELAQFYEQSENFDGPSVSFHHEGGRRPWLIADPEMSKYVGDISTLESKGYLTVDGNGWEWRYPREATYIDI